MKKILLHNGNNNIIKAINKFLAKNLDQNQTQILFNTWHNQLFAVYQKYKPDIVVWPASEFTQELHDFITEYHKEIKLFLIADIAIEQSALNDFINSIANIKVIKNKNFNIAYKNLIAEYDSLYDHELFFDKNLKRNNKIIAILSPDNDKNHQLLDGVIYPNSKEIVVVNNPNFESVVNLGLVNYNDLAFFMNIYSRIIDIDNLLSLEAAACNIQIIDIADNAVSDAIENNKTKNHITDLENHTYEKFVNEHIIPHFGI